MSWWTTIKDSALSIGSGLAEGGMWFWNNLPIQSVTTSFMQFSGNTAVHLLAQGQALRTAVPALLYHEETHKIVNGIGSILKDDVVPVLTVNFLNNAVQHYFRNQGEEQTVHSYGYSLFLHSLTLGNYLVMVYSLKRGVETAIRLAVIESAAPAAFIAATPHAPITRCHAEGLNCTVPRWLKGSVRELGVLWANEALIAGIYTLPYATPVAHALTVANVGRYITRTITPNRCERHKFMQQEFVLAVGLTYMLNNWLLSGLFSAKFGPVPALYSRTLQHLLLIGHVNMAAHMPVPLVEAGEATLFDLMHYYEQISRFVIDVIWSGLLKRIPIDFKSLPNQAPIVPLSTALRFGIGVFNSDLEREYTAFSAHPVVHRIKDWTIPMMFRSSYRIREDKIFALYWSDICAAAIAILTTIESQHTNTSLLISAITWNSQTAKTVAQTLDYTLGIPMQLTKLILILSREKDFWELIHAMRAWFERHKVHTIGTIAPELSLRPLSLVDTAPPPEAIASTAPVALADRLAGQRTTASTAIKPDSLLTRRRGGVAYNPASLFSTRSRIAGARVDEEPPKLAMG